MKNKTCIVLVGPTAVGKTTYAIELAKHFNCPILSADSRQCYHELNIGVAKPSYLQLKEVDHYFINSHSVHEEVNAKTYELYGTRICEKVFETNDFIITTGGTGLYIKALTEGLDEIPEVSAAINKFILENYSKYGLGYLQDTLKQEDPKFYHSGEIQNPQRSIRALGVALSTGKSILDFQKNIKEQRPYGIIKLGLELPREELIDRINNRVDLMIQAGLEAEVNELRPLKNLNALQTVGYSEFFDYWNGDLSKSAAIEKIKINTRKYAKRQMTWFKRDPGIHWFNASTPIGVVINYLKDILVSRT